MNLITDQAYLKTQQYKASGNLRTRMSIHQRFSTNPTRWTQWVFDHLQIQAGQRVLELGCGTGALWLENMERLPEGIEIILSDYSAGMLTAAKAQLSADERFRFVQLDAQAIAFESCQFDLVIANHMLYHVPDLPQSLVQIRRVLKHGGHLSAATNGETHMRELYQLMRSFPYSRIYNDSAQHFGLQNGDALLAGTFASRELFIYPDSLWVTEAELLVAYITSMWGVEDWDAEKFSRLEKIIKDQICERGGFAIQKSTGMFWAGGK